MNKNFPRLQPYPFEKQAKLLASIEPPAELSAIKLSIGEPKGDPPAVMLQALTDNLDGFGRYPLTKGDAVLREAISGWLERRFSLPQASINPETQVLPVNGTREALFAFAQCVVDASSPAKVLMPNPFYQIYEGAAILAGAEPVFLNCVAENGFKPDFDDVDANTWKQCQLLYICSPGNPTGAVLSQAELEKLVNLAEQHDFIIASDECYSEIYREEGKPPPGLLSAAAAVGNTAYKRCVVFHSLSKRSNAPGVRSGFVAGDAAILKDFLLYRTYHGCAMPQPVQAASVAAWEDETHVQQNRQHYRQNFASLMQELSGLLDLTLPDAGFYLWPQVPDGDERFTQRLLQEQNITVLPGSYLSRTVAGVNPGNGYVRMALVASPAECLEAAQRIRRTLEAG